jgi:hypothetical protein
MEHVPEKQTIKEKKLKVNWVLRINNRAVQQHYRDYQQKYVIDNIKPFFLIYGLNGLFFLIMYFCIATIAEEISGKVKLKDYDDKKKAFLF